jgi:hypothetical protein
MPVALVKWLEMVSIFLIIIAAILLTIYELNAVFNGVPTISDQVRIFTQKNRALAIAIALEIIALETYLFLHFFNLF